MGLSWRNRVARTVIQIHQAPWVMAMNQKAPLALVLSASLWLSSQC